jgi:hypothetical protein
MARFVFPLRSPPPIGRAAVALCAVLAILALGSNIASMVRMYRAAPSLFEHVTAVAQVRQEWALFAPVPVHHAWTYRATGRASDGSVIALNNVLPVTTLPGPGDGAVHFSSHRWLKYHVRFDRLSADEWSSLGQYLCRRARTVAGSAVRTIEVEMSSRPVIATAYPDDIAIRQGAFDCAATP